MLFLFLGVLHLCAADTNLVTLLNKSDADWGAQFLTTAMDTNYGYLASFYMKVADLSTPGPLDHESFSVFWRPGMCFILASNIYEHPPIYIQPKEQTPTQKRTDYDISSNLIVWRPLERTAVFSNEQNEMHERLACYKVSPDGRLLSTNITRRLYKFEVGRHDCAVYYIDLFLRSLGKGFGPNVQRITAFLPKGPLGETRVEALGNCGGIPKGKWTLTLEYANGSDILVRKASFWPDGAINAAFSMKNSGLLEERDLKVATFGTLSISDMIFEFQLADLRRTYPSSEPARLLIESVQRSISSTPAGSHVTDFRGPRAKQYSQPSGADKGPQ